MGGCKRKFGRSQFLKTFSFFTIIIIIFFMFDVFFIFIIILLFFMFFSFKLKSAQYSSYSGCLARDEFLVIREGYHMLFYIPVVAFFCCSALH